MKYTEIELRGFSIEEIYHFLAKEFDTFDVYEQVVLCDELLQRNLPIRYIKPRFESLVRKLRIKELKNIDAYDFNFSKATVFVAIDEIIKQGQKPLEWLYISKFEGQKGPVSRLEIDKLISKNEIDESSLLWRIGMKDWKKAGEMPYLLDDRFYDQEFEQDTTALTTYEPSKANEPSQSKEFREPISSRQGISRPFSIVPGVMELLSFPMWIILIFMFFFTGFASQAGVVLPFLFSILVLISIIPVGIGLLARQKWAYSIKIATATMTVMLVLFKIVVDHSGGFWGFVLIYQLIILGLLFYNKESYDPIPV